MTIPDRDIQEGSLVMILSPGCNSITMFSNLFPGYQESVFGREHASLHPVTINTNPFIELGIVSTMNGNATCFLFLWFWRGSKAENNPISLLEFLRVFVIAGHVLLACFRDIRLISSSSALTRTPLLLMPE